MMADDKKTSGVCQMTLLFEHYAAQTCQYHTDGTCSLPVGTTATPSVRCLPVKDLALKERILASLSQNKKVVATSGYEPRYDDVFEAGTRWLNKK